MTFDIDKATKAELKAYIRKNDVKPVDSLKPIYDNPKLMPNTSADSKKEYPDVINWNGKYIANVNKKTGKISLNADVKIVLTALFDLDVRSLKVNFDALKGKKLSDFLKRLMKFYE